MTKSAKKTVDARRRIVRHLLDLGRTDAEIVEAINECSGQVIRRDLAAIRAEDEGKSSLETMSERVIRLAEDQLADPTLSGTSRTRALTALQKAQVDLLRARHEVSVRPGVGLVVRDELEEYEEDPEDAELLAGRPPLEEDEEYWEAQVTEGRYRSPAEAKVAIARRRESLDDIYWRRLQEAGRLQWLFDRKVNAEIEELGADEYFRRLHAQIEEFLPPDY